MTDKIVQFLAFDNYEGRVISQQGMNGIRFKVGKKLGAGFWELSMTFNPFSMLSVDKMSLPQSAINVLNTHRLGQKLIIKISLSLFAQSSDLDQSLELGTYKKSLSLKIFDDSIWRRADFGGQKYVMYELSLSAKRAEGFFGESFDDYFNLYSLSILLPTTMRIFLSVLFNM